MGADINHANNEGCTALHYASENGGFDAVVLGPEGSPGPRIHASIWIRPMIEKEID